MDFHRLRPEEWPGAIADGDGRQIVVAGPGTGKTEFLVRRVVHLVRVGTARPDEIVVLAFSRRAAALLEEKIEALRAAAGVPVDVTTFHSLALRLIETAGEGERPVPLTTPEQVGVVRDILRTETPDDWPLTYRGILDSPGFAAEVADFMLRCSERLLTSDDLADRAQERADWRGLPDFYRRYQDHLTATGRTDYGLILARAVELLDREPSLTGSLHYVIVDEYQDTTPAQAEMAELLARAGGNLTVAGDPYQSIFSFRGAEVRNVAAFSERAPTRRIVLAESFRVPAPILESALRVVTSGDLPGAAGTVEPAPGPGSVEAYVFDQQTAEAEWIAAEVEYLVRVEGMAPAAIAVLVRSKRELLAELSRALDRRQLPHDPPDSRLVGHPAVGLFHDLVTAAVHGGESSAGRIESSSADAAVRRLLLGPLVGAGIGEEREMLRHRRRTSSGWHEVIAANRPDLTGLIRLLGEADWATGRGAADGFWEAWTTLDGLPDLVDDPARSDWRRAWAAFGQMLARQAERDPDVTLRRFFELVDEDDFEATPLLSHRPREARITLSTLHQVKGLEFEVVFIANAIEGVFPDLRRGRRMLRPELLSPERTIDPAAQHLFQLQEEMRLAYTAMTRARRRAVWTATDAGIDQGEGRPSRFLFAAAGDRPVGQPRPTDREPLTISEAETRLRRQLLDVSSGPARRLAAANVLGSPARAWWEAASFAGAPEPGPDRPVHGGRFRLSPSQAEAYQTCPRRYVLERRLRLGDSTSVYAHFGDLVHEVLEKAEAEVIGTGRNHADLHRVLETVDEVWERAEFGTPHLDEAWKRKAIEMLTKLYERWPGKGEPVDVEMLVETEIDGVVWTGRVDRVERGPAGLRVIDYKTGTRVPTKEEAGGSVQLAFYSLAVEHLLEEPVPTSEMWFPRVDSKSITTRSLDAFRRDEVQGSMVEVGRSIAAEEYPPRVSEACNRCDFRRSCPAWPEGRGAFLA